MNKSNLPTKDNSRIAKVRNWYDSTKEYNIYGDWAKVDTDDYNRYLLQPIDGYCCTSYKRGGTRNV